MKLYTKDEMAAAWDAGYHARKYNELAATGELSSREFNPYRPIPAKADQPVATETSHLAALSKYSVESCGPCGDGDGDPGPSSQRRYESDYDEADTAPQGAPRPACTCSCICDGTCGCPCHDDEPGIDERRAATCSCDNLHCPRCHPYRRRPAGAH